MPQYLEVLRNRQPYVFFITGLVWLGLAVYVWSAFLLWPVLALISGGVLLLYQPTDRVTWPWTMATLGLAIVLAFYQVASDIALMGGPYSTLAAESLVVFLILGVFHLVMAYTNVSTPSGSKTEG